MFTPQWKTRFMDQVSDRNLNIDSSGGSEEFIAVGFVNLITAARDLDGKLKNPNTVEFAPRI
ncbi:hypothetical protein WG66_012563 [Moniliophthora roreri]|nr:hypothetical protein WG66_012563 [Moniliophthora roreri]